MTNANARACPWLPEGSLTAPRTAGPVADAIGDWVTNWFAAPTLRASPCWARLPAPAGQTDGVWSSPQPLSAHMALQSRDGARDAIGGILLALPVPRGLTQANDQELMRSVSDGILADLAGRLERFAAGLDNLAWPSGGQAAHDFCLAIEDEHGRAVLRVLADRATLIALARRGIERRKPVAALTARADTLAETRVACGALLGRATLPYSEVRNLAAGDVLILNAARGAAYDLLVDGKVAARGAIRMPAADAPPLSQ